MLRREHPLDHAITCFESFREFFWLVAAAFGHVGFAATTASNDGRQLLNDQPGRNFLW